MTKLPDEHPSSISAIASRLREARKLKYKTADAAAVVLGMAAPTIRAHERGQNGFPLSTALEYARVYGVEVSWLMSGDGDSPTLATPGGRIDAARRDMGLSSEELATRIGIAASSVRAHLNGQNAVRPDMALKYARELEVTPDWILFGPGDPASERSAPPARQSPISLIADARGLARLQIDKTVPMSVALKVLALLEGGE